MIKKSCLVFLFYLYQVLDAHPNLCQDARIDTITRVKDGSTYVFKGDSYWKILSTGGIASGYPRYISSDWDGLEGFLDASATSPNGETYFFKGNSYWLFTNKNSHGGYPKVISENFEEIPGYLDAAFVWRGNTYFVKGDKYWRNGTNCSPSRAGYPMQVTGWSNKLASGIDAAFQWENGRTYFFKGDKYYLYNDDYEEIESATPPYPHSTAKFWFKCR